MLDTTKSVIETLEKEDKIDKSNFIILDGVLGDGIDIIQYETDTGMIESLWMDKSTKIDDRLSYIRATIKPDFIKVNESVLTDDESEKTGTDLINKIVVFDPIDIDKYDMYLEPEEKEKLEFLSQFKPHCQIIEEAEFDGDLDTKFYIVDFNIDDNIEILPEDYLAYTYLILSDDIKLIDENEESVKVKEDTDIINIKNNSSVSLLTALQSEKEAVMIYEMLIKTTKDKEELELLHKILDDEKEHIALLSGLQSSKMADFVAEDNKETLDTYAEDILDS